MPANERIIVITLDELKQIKDHGQRISVLLDIIQKNDDGVLTLNLLQKKEFWYILQPNKDDILAIANTIADNLKKPKNEVAAHNLRQALEYLRDSGVCKRLIVEGSNTSEGAQQLCKADKFGIFSSLILENRLRQAQVDLQQAKQQSKNGEIYEKEIEDIVPILYRLNNAGKNEASQQGTVGGFWAKAWDRLVGGKPSTIIYNGTKPNQAGSGPYHYSGKVVLGPISLEKLLREAKAAVIPPVTGVIGALPPKAYYLLPSTEWTIYPKILMEKVDQYFAEFGGCNGSTILWLDPQTPQDIIVAALLYTRITGLPAFKVLDYFYNDPGNDFFNLSSMYVSQAYSLMLGSNSEVWEAFISLPSDVRDRCIGQFLQNIYLEQNFPLPQWMANIASNANVWSEVNSSQQALLRKIISDYFSMLMQGLHVVKSIPQGTDTVLLDVPSGNRSIQSWLSTFDLLPPEIKSKYIKAYLNVNPSFLQVANAQLNHLSKEIMAVFLSDVNVWEMLDSDQQKFLRGQINKYFFILAKEERKRNEFCSSPNEIQARCIEAFLNVNPDLEKNTENFGPYFEKGVIKILVGSASAKENHAILSEKNRQRIDTILEILNEGEKVKRQLDQEKTLGSLGEVHRHTMDGGPIGAIVWYVVDHISSDIKADVKEVAEAAAPASDKSDKPAPDTKEVTEAAAPVSDKPAPGTIAAAVDITDPNAPAPTAAVDIPTSKTVADSWLEFMSLAPNSIAGLGTSARATDRPIPGAPVSGKPAPDAKEVTEVAAPVSDKPAPDAKGATGKAPFSSKSAPDAMGATEKDPVSDETAPGGTTIADFLLNGAPLQEPRRGFWGEKLPPAPNYVQPVGQERCVSGSTPAPWLSKLLST